METAISFDLKEYTSVDSTNTVLRRLAGQGAPEGTLVFAHEQTAGRGRQGNHWVSLQGNLFVSLLLRPAIEPRHVGQLSFLVALALLHTIRAYRPDPTLRLKWPNDILLSGRKVAGILLESEGVTPSGSLPWVVAGFGVNLTRAPDGAVALHEAGWPVITPRDFLQKMEPVFSELYARWQKDGFATLSTEWTEYAAGIGQNVRARLSHERFVEGIFEGLGPEGELVLRLEDGEKKLISSGEVYL